MAYNANTDYLALINKANAAGDSASAAKYEAQRNEKIAAMNAAGTNTQGYKATNSYGSNATKQQPAATGNGAAAPARNMTWVEANIAQGDYDYNNDFQASIDAITKSGADSGNWKSPGVLTDSAAEQLFNLESRRNAKLALSGRANDQTTKYGGRLYNNYNGGYGERSDLGAGSGIPAYGGRRDAGGSSSSGSYVAKGVYNDADVASADKAKLSALSAQYKAAIAAGNVALANQYHRQAEDIRAKYGYSGGADGSEYIALLKEDPNTSGNQNISSYNLSDYSRVNTAGIAPTKASLMGKSLGDTYGIDYDKDTILSLLNGATKAQYDAQRQTTQETTDDFYNQMSASQAGLLNTLRSNQAGAVATGASKGMAAAQELSALLGLQATNTQGATDLANAKNKLDAEEAAAYATNTKTALDTSNSLKQAIANLDSTKYGYDTQGYASELDYTAALKAVLGEIIQSQNSANATIANAAANLEGTKYAADSNKNSSYSSSRSYTSGASNAAASGSGAGATVKAAEPATVGKYANTGIGNDQYTKNSDGTYTVYPEKGGPGKTLNEAGWQTYRMEGTLDALENNSYGTNTVKAALKTAGSQVPTSASVNKVGAGLGGWSIRDTANVITVNGGQYVKDSKGIWYTKTKTGMSRTSDPFNSLINANTTPTHITVDSRSYIYNEDKGYWLCNGKRVSANTVAGALKSGTSFSWSK